MNYISHTELTSKMAKLDLSTNKTLTLLLFINIRLSSQAPRGSILFTCNTRKRAVVEWQCTLN